MINRAQLEAEEAEINKKACSQIWEHPEIQNQISLHADDEMISLPQLVNEAFERLKAKHG